MGHSSEWDLVFKNRPYYHPNFPIMFMWSPNSGSTLLLSWFFFQVGLLEKAKNYHPWIHYYENNVYKHVYSNELAESLEKKEKKVYKLVCNPYVRAVNCFLMLYLNEEPYWYNLRKKIKEALPRHSNQKNSLSFKRFLYYLKDLGVDVASTDSHFAGQYVEGEEHYVDQIIHLENLGSHLSILEKKYRLRETNYDHLLSQDFSRYMSYEGHYAEADLDDPSFPIFPTYSSFYDEETKRLVEDIYHQDFVNYGYQKNLDLIKS